MSRLRAIAHLLLSAFGLVIVNLLLNPGNPLSGWQMLLAPGVAWESLALLLLLPWLPAIGRWLLAALIPLLTLLRLADIVTPQLFGRAFIAPLDIAFAPQLMDLALAGTTLPTRLILLGVVLLGVLALVWLIARILELVRPRDRSSASLMMVPLALALIWLPARQIGRDDPWLTFASGVSLVEAVRATIDTGREGQEAVSQALAQRPTLPTTLPGLAGRDVLLIFIESYGMVTRTAPILANQIDPVRRRLETDLTAAGFHAASLALAAPITGGGSWLAHATTLAGIPIDSQGRHDALVLAAPVTLAGVLGKISHAIQPQMRGPWPEGRRLGFGTTHTGDDLPYAGPRYSWNSLPDRFTLDWTARTLLSGESRPPIFAMIVLASSHAPFDRVPPLLSPDEAGVDGQGYASTPPQEFPLVAGNIRGQGTGFAAAIAYSLAAVGDFLTRQFPGDGLVIVLGDHQPPLDLVGGPQDKRVIVHLLSRDAGVIAPWRAEGAANGLHLPADALHGQQSDLLGHLIRHYAPR